MQANETDVRTGRYVPDLKGFMGDCEANYVRFLHLLPALDSADVWSFGVRSPGDTVARVHLRVLERSRYTTTLTMEQDSPFPDWIPQPVLTVRLYHDARMAEVLSCQDLPRIRQSYPYPNRRMYHRDEKAQVNALLGEWLLHCLAEGCALDLPSF